MKVVRTYKLTKDFLWCTCDFIADESEWENDLDSAATVERFPVMLRWTLGYKEPKSPFDVGVRLSAHAHPNVRQSVILAEMARFIQTINQMYEL